MRGMVLNYLLVLACFQLSLICSCYKIPPWDMKAPVADLQEFPLPDDMNFEGLPPQEPKDLDAKWERGDSRMEQLSEEPGEGLIPVEQNNGEFDQKIVSNIDEAENMEQNNLYNRRLKNFIEQMNRYQALFQQSMPKRLSMSSFGQRRLGKTGSGLSIINPLDVLTRRLELQLKRKMKLKTLKANEKFLQELG